MFFPIPNTLVDPFGDGSCFFYAPYMRDMEEYYSKQQPTSSTSWTWHISATNLPYTSRGVEMTSGSEDVYYPWVASWPARFDNMAFELWFYSEFLDGPEGPDYMWRNERVRVGVLYGKRIVVGSRFVGAVSNTLIGMTNGGDAITYDLPFDITGKQVHLVWNIPAGSSKLSDVQIYVNGQLITGAPYYSSDGSVSVGADAFSIGKKERTKSIAHLRAYQRALTASEIADLYKSLPYSQHWNALRRSGL